MSKIGNSTGPSTSATSYTEAPQNSAPAAGPAENTLPAVQQESNPQTQKSHEQGAQGRKMENTLGASVLQSQLQSNLPKPALKEGMKGKEVEQLQNQLIELGYMTKEQKATGPGIFGPKTEAALKAFQRDHGLKQDGIFGSASRKALGGVQTEKKDPVQQQQQPSASQVKSDTPAAQFTGAKEVPDSQLTTARSPEEQAKLYDKYEKLIPEGKLKTGANEMNIVGLRHHDIGNNKDLRSYDDRFVVMWKDDSGQKHVKVFEGATHTGQKSTKGNFTDVNKDGKADIAYIKPGTYDFHMGKSEKYGDHLRPDQKIGAWRDTNQDGRITGDEKDTNYTATAILFHKGGTSAPKSVGCQTLAPDEYQRFIDLIKQDPNGKVSYTLADASN